MCFGVVGGVQAGALPICFFFFFEAKSLLVHFSD